MSSGSSLEDLGAIPAPSFGDLVTRCHVIFAMVADDAVLEELVQQAVEGGKSLSGKIFVDSSTVHPDTVNNLSALLSKHQASFLSAPVFGGPAIAIPGKLVVAIVGPKSACGIVEPYIQDVIGKNSIVCGEDAQNASMLKIAGNIVTLNLMEAVGEAQVFAEQTGLETGPMEELITDAFGPVAGGYSQRMTSGTYAPPLNKRPEFGVSLSIKDATYALDIAAECKVKLPALGIVDRNMKAAQEQHGECLDCSSIYGALRSEAGLSFWNEKSRQGN